MGAVNFRTFLLGSQIEYTNYKVWYTQVSEKIVSPKCWLGLGLNPVEYLMNKNEKRLHLKHGQDPAKHALF